MSQATDNNFDDQSVRVELVPAERRVTLTQAAGRTARGLDAAGSDAETIPLPARPSNAPRARPEFEEDDDDGDGSVALPMPKDNRGVDDGFFGTESGFDSDNNHLNPNGFVPRRRPSLSPFPYAPDFDPNNPTTVPSTPIPDVNVYQHKKTLAQGMMDLALLSANANQLRYVLESYQRHPYYYTSLTFISISIIFQIAVGIGLILNSRFNVKNEKDMCKANKINNFTVIGIFIVTIVNVFISAFGVANPPADMNG